jgi:hypothetical protein
MLEDCQSSNKPVKVKESHFNVFPEFVGASYAKRYELFCRKLLLERHYTSTAFIMSKSNSGLLGDYSTPAKDLSIEKFVTVLSAHVSSFK